MKLDVFRLLEGCVKNIGACALLSVMLMIALSVAGRHLGIPVPGSIEMAELLILLVASASLVYTTIQQKHASANFFVEHMPDTLNRHLEKVKQLVSLVLCLGLIVGNAWLIIDVWSLDEASHLLGIPIVPFRIVWLGAILMVTAHFVVTFFSGLKNTAKEGET